MPADVLTKGKERGHVELLRKLLHSARYQIRWRKEDKLVNANYCDIKNAEKQASNDHEKHLGICFNRFLSV